MPSGRIFRTADAVVDLDGIWDYIARDKPAAADRMLDELKETFVLSSSNPEIGELQPLLADGTYRRFTCRNSVIYYRPLEDGIVLVRILHCARSRAPALVCAPPLCLRASLMLTDL